MASKRSKAGWTEKDFEDWFCQRQALPDGEQVLVIARQKRLRRVVDLVALDTDGGLVLLEVKNEAATRQAVGQSLEYLAQYANVTVDDVGDDYVAYKGDGASLRADFQERFGHELQAITERRRVFLVAPRFDPAASIGASYLTELFAGSQVSYALVTARLAGQREFELAVYQPAITLPKDLHDFVTNARGRLFYVLEPGPKPIIWSVGRRTETGELKLNTSRRRSHRTLRVATRPMILDSDIMTEVDLRGSGKTWARKTNPRVHAKVIGVVTAKRTSYFVLARFVDGAWQRFFQLDARTFHRRFERREVDLPGWKIILQQIDAQTNR